MEALCALRRNGWIYGTPKAGVRSSQLVGEQLLKGEQLERDLAARVELLGRPDDAAHAAAAQGSSQSIPRVDQLARPADSVEEVGVGDGGALLVRARC